jgi:hypothetical protein
MSFTGSTEIRSRDFYSFNEDELFTIDELLYTYAFLEVIDVGDIFWLTLDIRLFRKRGEQHE